MNISVKNLNGSGKQFSNPQCCNSWIDHWNTNRYHDSDLVSANCDNCVNNQ